MAASRIVAWGADGKKKKHLQPPSPLREWSKKTALKRIERSQTTLENRENVRSMINTIKFNFSRTDFLFFEQSCLDKQLLKEY